MQDQDQYPVFVHCTYGVLRTGVMVALYQIAFQHKHNRAVWEQMPRFGHDFTKPSMQRLKEFILNFKSSQIQDAAAWQLLTKKGTCGKTLKNKGTSYQQVDERVHRPRPSTASLALP